MKAFLGILTLALALAIGAHASDLTPVEFFGEPGTPALANQLRGLFTTSDTRLIRAEKSPTSSAWTVRLFSKRYHRFQTTAIDFSQGHARIVLRHHLAQPAAKPVCPDPQVQFIAFAPNDDAFEQQITADVAHAAEAKGFKTVYLAKQDATAEAYLNYLSCPRLIGDFYDGDANPDEIVTYGGSLTSETIAATLAGTFNYKVTHIWLACEAYNNPMLDTMINVTRSQKYAAGINDLEIGPSDNSAACAMKAAINGEAMTAAFDACRTQFDNKTDQWGWGGNGADYLGH